MSALQRRTLLHKGMLAIHADPLGKGGSRVGSCRTGSKAEPTHDIQYMRNARSSVGGCQVWVKPLAGNESAVALLNLDDTPIKPTISFGLLGYPATASLGVADVWAEGAKSVHRGGFTTPELVAAHGTTVLRVSHG